MFLVMCLFVPLFQESIFKRWHRQPGLSL